MSVHQFADPSFFEEITSESLAFTRQIAHDAGIEAGTVLVGEPGTAPPAALMLRMSPGYRLERHAHNTHRVEVIVHGSVTLPDGRVLGPGDVQISAPGETYGPLVVGPDGATTLEIFGSVDGLPPIPPADSDPDAAAFLQRVRDETIAGRAASNA